MTYSMAFSKILRGATMVALPLSLATALTAMSCSSEGGGDPDGKAGESGGGTGGGSAGGRAGSAGAKTMGGSESRGGEGGSHAGQSGSGGDGEGGSSAGQSGSGGGGEGGGGGSGPCSGGASAEDDGSDHGFAVRKPGELNTDWICTFTSECERSYVYFQTKQTGKNALGVPLYEVEQAQLSRAGMVSPLANPVYDAGGRHNNDSIFFDLDGRSHRYWHSSFGFGFRKCQPMDCRSVYQSGDPEEATRAGCIPQRLLPEVCVEITADGTHEPLIDNFRKCPGDFEP